MQKLNIVRQQLYNCIDLKGLKHRDTIKCNKKLDKLIVKDTKRYNVIAGA